MAAVLPALYVMRGVAAKRPFFEQLRGGILAFGAGLVAAMLIAYASFGGGMVARFVDMMRAEFARMPDAALQPIVDADQLGACPQRRAAARPTPWRSTAASSPACWT